MTQDTIQQRPGQRITVTASRSRSISLVVIIGACCCLPGCTAPSSKQTLVEAPLASPSVQSQTAQAQQMEQSTLPDINKVQEAVRRVFKETALIDTTRKPSFITGDFNGDLSADLAVVLKPAPGKLSEINQEFPPWILKDPFTTHEPGKPSPLVTENELLLAVIHGYGANGWSDQQATQTYLLKNAVGSELQAHPGKQFVAANRGKNLPRLNGDMIGEKLKGSAGYLYYARATYSWYDPKTFKGESGQSAGHSSAMRQGQDVSQRLAPSVKN